MKISTTIKALVIYIAVLITLSFLISCDKEELKECWTCTHADGSPLPLAPCQPKPVVIYDADGHLVPVKCVKN